MADPTVTQRAPGPPAVDALDQACAGRPEMAAQLTEWAHNTFGHAMEEPARLRSLVAAAVAHSELAQGQLQRLAAEQGELNLSELPPVPLQRELITAFAVAGISVASYETADGERRSARLGPARGRSLAKSVERRGGRSCRPSSKRGRRGPGGASSGDGSDGGGGNGRSRSRSRGYESE